VLKLSELIQRNEEIAFVLTDFMMPRLNGIQAVQKMQTFLNHHRANNPDFCMEDP
jgi:CheY-like chemotaxis protein